MKMECIVWLQKVSVNGFVILASRRFEFSCFAGIKGYDMNWLLREMSDVLEFGFCIV